MYCSLQIRELSITHKRDYQIECILLLSRFDQAVVIIRNPLRTIEAELNRRQVKRKKPNYVKTVEGKYPIQVQSISGREVGGFRYKVRPFTVWRKSSNCKWIGTIGVSQ